LTLLIIAQIY